MFDFWLTMGSMVVDPSVLPEMEATRPVFTPIPVTLNENGIVKTIRAAGRLDDTSTTAVREKLQSILNARFYDARVTVSLYAAGKICQFLNIDGPLLHAQMPVLQAAYNDAAAANGLKQTSSRLAALIGVCLIDDTLSRSLQMPGIGELVAADFFVPAGDTPEWKTLLALLKDRRFLTAQPALTLSATWDHGCFQRFTFYDKFEMAAN